MRSPRKRSSEFSSVSDGGMFESRPFVVQSKVGEEGKKSGLKTSLMRAERYGHHLSQMNPSGFSNCQAVQPKLVTREPMQSQWVEATPMQLARTKKSKPLSTSSPLKPKTGTSKVSKPTASKASGSSKPKGARTRADAVAKQELGHVPGTYSLPDKNPGDFIGTYQGQRNRYTCTPTGNKVEADHMTPDTLHQPLGKGRKSSGGSHLSTRLPAAQLPYELHRRKLTTGSGKEVEAHRAYLLYAHHGMVPFDGPMGAQQDYNAAAMEVDLRSTFGDRTVFGVPNIHDNRPLRPSEGKGAIPLKDMVWSTERMKEMTGEAARQGRINKSGHKRLNSTITKELNRIGKRYPKKSK
ncbi:MAG TPA: hypothetical protein DDW76_06215 [Cyanobacteria bacterium UBA11369]|nr:hypothetical protein [Cyanobacteria bacterium UBA11371]HBE29786.1 hypothetical protein [Cyanobacteria bacterium UBA11368]HBE48400.1 hypothetical protein [Cyanobacteria bacterium UBA11369]